MNPCKTLEKLDMGCWYRGGSYEKKLITKKENYNELKKKD